MGKLDYFELFFKALTVIFGLIAIYMIIIRLIGASPSLSQVNSTLIVMMGSWLMMLTYKFGRFEGRFEQFVSGTFRRFEENVRESFYRIKEDIKEIKTDMKDMKGEIKEGVTEFKEDLKAIRRKLS